MIKKYKFLDSFPSSIYIVIGSALVLTFGVAVANSSIKKSLSNVDQSFADNSPTCTRTLNPGDKIQDAIDAVSNRTAPYVLCLNPGYYIGGLNEVNPVPQPKRKMGDKTFAQLTTAEKNGDWWNSVDAETWYGGGVVIKNRKNFTLRGLKDATGKGATIFSVDNDESYQCGIPGTDSTCIQDTESPEKFGPLDRAILIKVVNGDNINIEGLTLDGFVYDNYNDSRNSPRKSIVNRLVWLQKTKNSTIHHNIIKNAGAECTRILSDSQHNKVYNNDIHSCGYYTFKIHPLKRLNSVGEAVYIGSDPYQIRANQTNRKFYWGSRYDFYTDRSSYNEVYNNKLYPGSRDDFNIRPKNTLRAGEIYEKGFGNECVDLKEDFESVQAEIATVGFDTQRGEPGHNLIKNNTCQGQFDSESGAFDSRGSNNIFEHNRIFGRVQGSAIRIGGGGPKPILVDPTPSDPIKGWQENTAQTTILRNYKWMALNTTIRKNSIESAFNDSSTFPATADSIGVDYTKEDCESIPPYACSELNTKYFVKTFRTTTTAYIGPAPINGWRPEPLAIGQSVCGNVNKTNIHPPDNNWGANWKGQSMAFNREPTQGTNVVCTADTSPAGPGATCIGSDCNGNLTVTASPQPSCPSNIDCTDDLSPTPFPTATDIITPQPTNTTNPSSTAKPTTTPRPTKTSTPAPTRTPSTTLPPITGNGSSSIADTFITAESSDTNYGNRTTLRAEAQPELITYFKFDLRNYTAVQEAGLSIRTTSDGGAGSNATQFVRMVNNTNWEEYAMTFTNRPAISTTTLGSISRTSPNNWYTIPLDASIIRTKLGGILSIAIVGSNDDRLIFYSRESEYKPSLIIK